MVRVLKYLINLEIKLDGIYNKVQYDLPEVDYYDKLGNKFDGTFKKIEAHFKPGKEVFNKFRNKLEGKYYFKHSK